jgi:iron complex outermembrane receptor protein
MQQRYRYTPVYLMVLQALASYAHAAPAPLDAAAVPAIAATATATAPAADDVAPAATAPAADAAAPAEAPMQVVEVTGQGQSRQVQNISRADLLKAVPGTSPLKVLDKLPGVNFQSADPFGSYEWSARISIRGFNQEQLGFTLDGVPLGDMSYGNNNGLHISRAISSENVGRVAVSQGAGALGTASTSNLGGTVQFYTLDPYDERGVSFSQTGGSDSTSRTFIRVDSGLLSTGTKFYLSGTIQRAEKWKGDGPQDQNQFNSKFVHRFGDNTLSGFFNYSDRWETDYQDMSLDMVHRLGYNWDNYAPDWQRAVNSANGIYSGGVTNMDDAYYLARGLRKDSLGGLSLDLALTANTDLKTTYYHHSNRGQGQWYTPYVPSPSGVPISIRTTEYSIGRDGITSDLTWTAGNHTVTAGVWGERSLHTLTRNYYDVDGPADTDYFLTGPFRTDFKQDFTTTTTQFYVQDEVALLDNKMKLNYGFKSPKVTIDATSLIGTRAGGELTASKSFLPQVGLNYNLDANDELFTSATRNMRAYQPGVDGPFSQTQAAFNLSTPNLKPETSTTVDLGMRFKRDALQGSLAVYYTDFDNRLLNVATCTGILGCPSTFVNVGKVETKGLEAVAVWKVAQNWSWFNSFTYNLSQYKSNYLDSGAIVQTDGKDVVDAPRVSFNTEITYENPVWYVRVGDKYTDKRYYTYTNDNSVPSYWLGSLSAGYKLGSVSMFKDLSLQFNISNLFDKQYFATVGSNGFVKSDPTGTFMTLLPGSPRQFFLTLSGKL